jgi:hypothetical protein
MLRQIQPKKPFLRVYPGITLPDGIAVPLFYSSFIHSRPPTNFKKPNTMLIVAPNKGGASNP